MQRLSRLVLGVMAGLPTPVSASIVLLGSALLAYSSGSDTAALRVGSAIAAVPAAERVRARELTGDEKRSRSDAAATLLERWAPNFAQETSPDHPERDRPLRIDFDDDWDATNNWLNLTPAQADAPPVVYGSAILTPTHAFLTYNLFYPRDWFSPACVSYVCHDNDLEVALLVVTRPSGSGDGEIVFLETKAHHDYVTARGHELLRDGAGRPWIEVESQGHGMHPIRVGERAAAGARNFMLRSSGSAPGELEGAEPYQLESLYETLWAQRSPSAAGGALWTGGSDGFLAYAGARHGRRGAWLGISMAGLEYAGGVRPPWGLKAPAGERGDWFLDPAYVALLRHGEWLSAASLSLDYVWNPFLEDLALECRELDCPAITPPPRLLPSAVGGLAGGALIGVGLLSLSARRRPAGGSLRSWRRWRGR